MSRSLHASLMEIFDWVIRGSIMAGIQQGFGSITGNEMSQRTEEGLIFEKTKRK